eukprot:scaffold16630_cov177-Amphora_coffeaeformis.AAC.3
MRTSRLLGVEKYDAVRREKGVRPRTQNLIFKPLLEMIRVLGLILFGGKLAGAHFDCLKSYEEKAK